MEVLIARNERMVGELAADIVSARLAAGGHPVIGLATGSSPHARRDPGPSDGRWGAPAGCLAISLSSSRFR